MLILFDNNVPKPLRRKLPGHYVRTAFEMGWAGLQNGSLLRAAEQARFDVFVTADQNLEYQQNMLLRVIGLVELGAGRWSLVQPHVVRIAESIDTLPRGGYAFIPIPLPPRTRRTASKPQ